MSWYRCCGSLCIAAWRDMKAVHAAAPVVGLGNVLAGGIGDGEHAVGRIIGVAGRVVHRVDGAGLLDKICRRDTSRIPTFLSISRNDRPISTVTVLLSTPPSWLQTASFIIPWMLYDHFYSRQAHAECAKTTDCEETGYARYPICCQNWVVWYQPLCQS